MAFDESVGLVCYGLVEGRRSSWVTQGPEGCGASGEAAVEAVCLKKIDKFARVFDKTWFIVVPTPCRVMSVEVPRQYSITVVDLSETEVA